MVSTRYMIFLLKIPRSEGSVHFFALKHEFVIVSIFVIIIDRLKYQEGGLILPQHSLHWNNLKTVHFFIHWIWLQKKISEGIRTTCNSTNWYHTSSWDSNRQPGSTIKASPRKENLLSVERSNTLSGENMTKFVVWKGFAVLLPIGTSLTPGGYS